MMVIKNKNPNKACDSDIHIPPKIIQIIFITVVMHPVERSIYIVFLPKGHNASEANFSVCRPKGIPMMVIISIRLAIRYSMAIKIPPNTNQMMLPKSFI
jgi:hypothetical protein